MAESIRERMSANPAVTRKREHVMEGARPMRDEAAGPSPAIEGNEPSFASATVDEIATSELVTVDPRQNSERS
jgi:hypothetical protein